MSGYDADLKIINAVVEAVNAKGITYSPGGPNSNSFAMDLLQALGFSKSDVWKIVTRLTPGDGHDLLTDEEIRAIREEILGEGTQQCFPAHTPVAVSLTQTRPISDLCVGDTVLAFDPAADLGRGALVPRKVVRLYRNTTEEWVKLTWQEGGETKELIATPGHHFLDRFGSFPTIAEMVANGCATVVLASGELTEVTAERIVYSAETAELFERGQLHGIVAGSAAIKPAAVDAWQTYNIEVEGCHTYVAGGVRVHNESGGANGGGGGGNSGDKDNDGTPDWYDEDYTNVGHLAGDRDNDGMPNAFDGDDGVGFIEIGTGDRDNDGTWNIVDFDDGVGPFDSGKSSPIIIDLDGDGVEVSLHAFIQFDMDGDTFIDLVHGWAGPQDGFLVIDLNADGSRGSGDGKIEQTKELVLSEWGAKGDTDLQALARAFDVGEYKDGVLNGNDAVWSELRIWQDLDQDGETDNGELKTLKDLGITEIKLTYDDGSGYGKTSDDINMGAVTLHGLASYTKDGKIIKGGVGDVSLIYNELGWKKVTTSAGFDIIFEQGRHLRYFDVTGKSSADVNLDGQVLDGAQGDDRANSLIATGHSRNVQISGGGNNDTIRGGDGDDLLSGDSGTDNIGGQGGDDVLFVDAQDLASGWVSGDTGLDTLIVMDTQAVNVTLIDHKVEAAVGGEGNDRLSGEGLGDDLAIRGGKGNDTITGGLGDDRLSGDEGDDRLNGAEGDDALFGGTGNDSLAGASGDDFVLAGTGDDSVTGSSGDDVLMGDARGDSITGGDHDDMIFGGTGNDTLSGQLGDDKIFAGSGNDVLFYFVGDDELAGESGNDTFRLKNDVEGHGDWNHWGWAIFYGGKGDDSVELIGKRSDWDIVKVGDNQWQISREVDPEVSKDKTGSTRQKVYIDLLDIETVRFGDGSRMTLSRNENADTSDDYVRRNPNKWSGDSSPTESQDGSFDVNGVLTGWMGNDVLRTASTINGDTGDDRIYADDNQAASLTGGSGSDVIVGQGGRDSLIGGSGTDQMAGGAGNDRLIGGTGADLMSGEAGDDSITGDTGSDLINGGSGSDTIEGGTGADQISGGSGDDVIVGDTGADRLAGDDGNDRIFGREGFDNIAGGTGNDRLYGGEGFNRVWGDNGEDALYGGSDDDELFGGEGEDDIFGGLGRDIIHGGAGADVMDGGAGILDQLSYAGAEAAVRIDLAAGTAGGGQAQGDRFTGFEQVFGGDGNDTLRGDAVDNLLAGSDGDDEINGRQGHDDLFGGAGDDKIYGEDGLDRLNGDAGDDTLIGGRGADTFFGGGGVDLISYEDAKGAIVFDWGDWKSRSGDAEGDVVGGGIEGIIGSDYADRIIAGNAGYTLFGGKGHDTLEGGDGDDLLDGEEGVNTLTGGAGDDTYVTNGVDVIIEAAGGGSDTVRASVTFRLMDHFEHLVLTGSGDLDGTGNARNNRITGNSGDNTLSGWGGDDALFGGNGADRLWGNDGDDRLSGGAGADRLTGGSGADSFVFDQPLSSGNADQITDFNAVDDTIRIDASVFRGLTDGTLSATAFVSNTSGNATNAVQRIIYETDTGELYFDRDGTGSGAKVLFATIGTGLTLTNADFLIF